MPLITLGKHLENVNNDQNRCTTSTRRDVFSLRSLRSLSRTLPCGVSGVPMFPSPRTGKGRHMEGNELIARVVSVLG